ncbi:uncharacterized protein A1O9_05605 [Exophiala aquamarina CBS 119918]|uniref:Ras-associating domain-containing protein n=1 Tax=Exophiala aquamarina CBS 119918 TaxID=1182545 RepID=A0A072PD41_9EURO|nr:uncharacterized protein A1O9_05605 [Exophiala aquamarina CBS 119918]KEF57687.1 hypothetical protein A1O9_05605 [Exophiala aquamarina CBS 119918]
MNNTPVEVSAQPAQPPKFLRYRSVRKTIVEEQSRDRDHDHEPVPSLPETSPVAQSSITRLPSRYHRKTKPTAEHSPVPSPQALPPQHHTGKNDHTTQPAVASVPTKAKNSEPRKNNVERSQRPSTRETRSKESGGTPRSTEEHPSPDRLRRSYEAAREEARLILEGEFDRLKILREQEAIRRHDQRVRQEEVKKREQERLDQIARKNTSQAKIEAKRPGGLHLDGDETKLTAETDKQGTVETQEPASMTKSRRFVIGGPPSSQREKRKHRRISSAIEPRHSSHGLLQQETSHNNPDEKRNSAPTANAPNFDAPVSAVNSGERRVSVKCKDSSITLPINPSTTCKEILNSAALVMSEPIDARTAVLVECFSQLGLERPLRRYERIRDVMNSWDSDGQHYLLVMEASEVAARGLHFGDVPAKQPLGTAVQMYHSPRPGRWDKRWLKLWDNGQISVSKNESGMDCINICHLSDFDVYTPTGKQIKKLKPPKKLSFALKSQQKASMFLNGANFVHFFCTKEKDVADQWYRGVHSWRSWYLVNMLGEGQQKETVPSMGQEGELRPGTGNSKESTPYVLGSFKPLLDFGLSRPSIEGTRQADADLLKRPSQDSLPRPLIDQVPNKASLDLQRGGSVRMTLKSQARPYSRRNGPLESSGQAKVLDEAEESAFTGKGLLARHATQRSQGGSRSGRGVSGVEGRPLVDLHPTSEFTDGSLLRKIEAWTAQEGTMTPKIDRQKRTEVNAPVGEGT